MRDVRVLRVLLGAPLAVPQVGLLAALERRTPLRRGGSLRRTSWERARQPLARVSKRRAGEAKKRTAINKSVLEAADGRCQIQAPGCWRTATQVHEVYKRSRFPGSQVDDTPKVACCGPCNSYVEDYPAWAEAHGWSVPSGTQPGDAA